MFDCSYIIQLTIYYILVSFLYSLLCLLNPLDLCNFPFVNCMFLTFALSFMMFHVKHFYLNEIIVCHIELIINVKLNDITDAF